MTAIAGPTTTAPLPAVDQSQLIAALEQTVNAVNQLIAALQTQAGSGASAGAAALGGGAQNMLCPCCAAQQAASGAGQVGQTTQAYSGAQAAPEPLPIPTPATDAAAPAESSKGEQLVAEAKKQLGKAYEWGAEGPNTFDCSGLMQYAAKALGINIPRVAKDQAKAGRAVDKSDLQPGDLVYFQGDGKSDISHIGMFIGDGKFIHAPKTGDVVKITNLESDYYRRTYRGARRIT